MLFVADPAERFAAELGAAEERLRAAGLGGRRAFVALARHLAGRLDLARDLWPEGPDAPASARLGDIPLAADVDLFGLAYERFFSDLFKGKRGQYFTPCPLVELVADLACVRPGERVLDPTCGSGGFLVAAHCRGADVDGIEVDPDLAVLARLNLALHGANPRAVVTADFFASPVDDAWDVVLANPPFSVRVTDPAVLRQHGFAQNGVASDIVFLRAALARLRPAGRLATILPWSLLTTPALAWIRDELDATCIREAVVSLPEGVFAPFGGTLTRACIVVLRKRPAMMARTLYAVIRQPGYDTHRRVYRRAEPDELVGLRLHLRGGDFTRALRLAHPSWLPEDVLAEAGAYEAPLDVPQAATFCVAERASVLAKRTYPDGEATTLSLGDIDAATGEFIHGGVRGAESDFIEVKQGEILFGRMRPELRKVAMVEVPDSAVNLPLVASPEFLRLRADDEPDFLLLALRSQFARSALPVTSGQTRPRARTDDIISLQLPDVPPRPRARIDTLLGRIRRQRKVLRQALLDTERLYEQFGAGTIDEPTLTTELERIESRLG